MNTPIVDSSYIINHILPLIPTGSITAVVYEANGKHYNLLTWELTYGLHKGAIPIVHNNDYNNLTYAEGSLFNNDLGTTTQIGAEFKRWVKVGYYITENQSHHQIHFSQESYDECLNNETIKHYNHYMVNDFVKNNYCKK